MSPRLPLKYRIAVVIFLLEAVMMALTLGITLSRYAESNRDQLAVSERVLLNLLSDLSRIALFTAEYDELQPYIEQVVADPHVVSILLADRANRVVVSSTVNDVGKPMPPLVDSDDRFWRTQEINNAAGRAGVLAINFSYAELNKSNRQALDLGITIALTGMALIAVVGIAIGYLLTRRLNVLTTVARRFSQGDLAAQTGFVGHDEIAELGQTFDHMARNIERQIASLSNTEQELRKARAELEQRVLERTAELAIARDQALDASRTKSAFLANMSHELRTPLNAVIGYSEMLIEEAADSGYGKITPDLLKIKTSGTHLLSLINDVLDLSKIEAGKMELYLEDFSIEGVVQETVAAVQPMLRKNGNALEVRCRAGIGTMCADKVKLRQALINLLSNAAKFTERGQITIEVQRIYVNAHEWVEFVVQDTGIGISPEQMSKLFGEFYQADASMTRKHGGTGLGLAISRRYCQLMGGSLTAQSQTDRGSVFKINLPACVQQINVKHGDELGTEFDPRLVRLGPQHGVLENNAERRKHVPLVLVIDDDVAAQELMRRYLTRHGVRVETAMSGMLGIELARRLRPDVITLDVLMPEMNGWETLQYLKKDPDLAHIPVIMLTMTEDKVRGYALGAAHFISKPIDRGAFMDVLTRVMRKDDG